MLQMLTKWLLWGSKFADFIFTMCSTLGPSACYTAFIKFLPLASGILNLEALRLVDTTTQQAIEIRDLPDIVSVRRKP
jgi:hypothetical protein